MARDFSRAQEAIWAGKSQQNFSYEGVVLSSQWSAVVVRPEVVSWL